MSSGEGHRRPGEETPLSGLGTILVRGAGEMATGVAVELVRAGARAIVMTERERPMAVRRLVSFSEAVRSERASVEGIVAKRASTAVEIREVWRRGEVAVVVDPGLERLRELAPEVFVDATMRKRNEGLHPGLAPFTLALGPGFSAGVDCQAVIETCRGPRLGRPIYEGPAEPDTGLPAPLLGHDRARVLRAPVAGTFFAEKQIGDRVEVSDRVGCVVASGNEPTAPVPVVASLAGLIRGLLADGSPVEALEKVGDIDPRPAPPPLDRISDKARLIGAGVVEAILTLTRTKTKEDVTP